MQRDEGKGGKRREGGEGGRGGGRKEDEKQKKKQQQNKHLRTVATTGVRIGYCNRRENRLLHQA
jgi:hypothetical protein